MIRRLFFNLLRITVTLVLLAVLLVIFHGHLLRFAGNLLICEDNMEKVPALFVLSGDPWDRGNEAVRLFKKGFAEKIICTGENVPRLFLIADIQYPESELTKMNILSQGVPSEKVILLNKGTSTKEEAGHILEYCRQNNIKKLAVVSTKFHTRRIRNTFSKKFKEAGMELIIRGAPSSAYSEDRWWQNEDGLIFVNNEYIKIMYYWMKGY